MVILAPTWVSNRVWKMYAPSYTPAPTDMKRIPSFNGMINYLSGFLPELAQLMWPIHQLTFIAGTWI